MAYRRPKSAHTLTILEKRELLAEYFDYYRLLANSNPELLNSKLPRTAVSDLLDEIGELILKKADEFANSESEVSAFLKENPLPESLEPHLPNEFRAFCLSLNALKQWVSAEQAATDRYIFGGTSRAQFRNLAESCLISGVPASDCTIELHHPVRDGRPPIPISKEAHSRIENQTTGETTSDPIMEVLLPIKRAGNRSWVMLKLGCELLLGIAETDRSMNVQSSSKTFARKAREATGKGYEEILSWLNENNLV